MRDRRRTAGSHDGIVIVPGPGFMAKLAWRVGTHCGSSGAVDRCKAFIC